MRWICVICSAALLMTSLSGIPASAEEVLPVASSENNDAVITAVGLIQYYSLAVNNSSGRLCINGTTSADEAMKTIGFTNIVVERSSNGTSGWTSAYTLNDVTSSNVFAAYITNKLISVTGGYYYRVSCNHYAKETGWFPRTESISNTSNTVYIP